MANTKSALKRVRQTKVRTSLNRALKSRVKLTRKNALAAYEAGDKAAAQEAFNLFASAAKSGAMHKGTASRIKGRMAVRLNGAGAQA